MSTLFDAGLTSIAILLYNCHKESLEPFFTPKTLDTNAFGKPGPRCNAVPMFPLLHECMYQVGTGPQLWGWERWEWFWASQSTHQAWEADSCVLVCSQLTDAALHGLKDIWNVGNGPTIGNIRKGFFLLELCRGSQPACFLTLGRNLFAFTWERHPSWDEIILVQCLAHPAAKPEG